MDAIPPPGGERNKPPPPVANPADNHPELIPADHADAFQRIGVAVVEGLRETSDTTFLKAWWALCWLHPGLHPDDHEEWPRAAWREFAVEAIRRAEAGSLRDHELYPAEATHNRLWRAFLAGANDPPIPPLVHASRYAPASFRNGNARGKPGLHDTTQRVRGNTGRHPVSHAGWRPFPFHSA